MLEKANTNWTSQIKIGVRATEKALGVSHPRTAPSEECQGMTISLSLTIMLVSQASLILGPKGLEGVAIASMMTTDLPITLTFIKISLRRLRMKTT